MLKCAAYVLVIVSLLMSPVIAGLNDLKCLTGDATTIAKADQGKAKDSHGKFTREHGCCTTHVHYGNSSLANSHLPSLLMTNLRLPLPADQFLAAFGPSPLLEPPSHA